MESLFPKLETTKELKEKFIAEGKELMCLEVNVLLSNIKDAVEKLERLVESY